MSDSNNFRFLGFGVRVKTRFTICSTIVGLIFGGSVLGQGLGNSPYSGLGIGESYGQATVTNLGMGGVGISYANPFYLNLQNPALLARRTRFTVFEVGLLGQSKQQSQSVGGRTQSQQSAGLNLGYLALAFPVSPRWTTSINLRPYTYTDYTTSAFQQVAGTNFTAQNSYSGKGGVNKVSFANGVRLLKNIYIGIEGSFLFGNIVKNSSAQVLGGAVLGTDEPADVIITRVDRVNYNGLVYKLGGAWRPKITNKLTLNVGATYDPSVRISGRQTNVYEQISLAGSPLSIPDTISNPLGKATLPQQIQGGFAVEYNNRLTVGIDVGTQTWSQFRNVTNGNDNLRDSRYIAAGFEFTPKPTSIRYRDLITYRAGFQIIQTPYTVSGKRINEANASVGFSLPLGAYYVNQLNLALIGGQRGVLTGGQLQERYLKISLGVSLNDWWFRKPVLD
jgi:hypothetical protein